MLVQSLFHDCFDTITHQKTLLIATIILMMKNLVISVNDQNDR